MDHNRQFHQWYSLALDTVDTKLFKSIELNEGQSLTDDTYTCNSENSKFCNSDHGHIITGDLNLIKKPNLRKHFYKGSNFREWQSLNYSRCKKEIEWTIKRFAGSLR